MITRLDDKLQFPDPEQAIAKPDGLLAIGGDLSVDRLLLAYRNGIFPFYDELDGEVVLWWSPSRRAVIFSDNIHISRRLHRTLKQNVFRVTFDQAFADVIAGCADRSTTWITSDMQNAYCNLHDCGAAHSIEVWQDDQLVGGLYGVGLGRMFFAESMFGRINNASKVAMAYLSWQLKHLGHPLFDCQFLTKHLQSMGAVEIPRTHFLRYLSKYTDGCSSGVNWNLTQTDFLLQQSL